MHIADKRKIVLLIINTAQAKKHQINLIIPNNDKVKQCVFIIFFFFFKYNLYDKSESHSKKKVTKLLP